MRKELILCIWMAYAVHANAQSIAEEKRYFDFLIGEWKMESKIQWGKSGTGEDTFQFERDLDGHAIISKWNFNRGTSDKPDIVSARYFSGFDTFKNIWTFYYVSNLSAQYWEGKKENGQWNFYKTFLDDGKPRLQRQTWLPDGKDGLIRIISNSIDNGQTWSEDFRGVFRRK